ncbi:MAG: hypothetical protein H0V80_17025, partial [Acidobacteria bacterium]|nr:hypothetical protein [Acidobacteriota bacterium]
DAASFARKPAMVVRVSGTTLRSPEADDGAADSLNVLAALAAARVPTYVVKRGDSLQQALATPALGAARPNF